MATLRPDGRWQASLLIQGKRRFFYGRTDEAAEAKKAAFEREINPEPLIEGTLSHFVETCWWPRIASARKLGTQRRYRDVFAKHIEPKLGDRQLPDLTYERLMAFMTDSAFPKPTARMVRGVLNGIFGLAYELQRVDRNPVKLLPTIKKTRKPKKNLTASMVTKLLETAKGTRMEGPCWTAAHIGLRRGEISALKVSDFLADQCAIELKATRDKFHEGPLKGMEEGETRVIPLTPALFKKLLSFRVPGHIYIFTDVDQKTRKLRPIHPDRISKSMTQLCKDAGVDEIDFHDLRAAAASNLRRAGVSLDTIRQILGHSTLDVTVVYFDENEADMREALEKLSSTYDVSGEL